MIAHCPRKPEDTCGLYYSLLICSSRRWRRCLLCPRNVLIEANTMCLWLCECLATTSRHKTRNNASETMDGDGRNNAFHLVSCLHNTLCVSTSSLLTLLGSSTAATWFGHNRQSKPSRHLSNMTRVAQRRPAQGKYSKQPLSDCKTDLCAYYYPLIYCNNSTAQCQNNAGPYLFEQTRRRFHPYAIQ